MFMAGLPDTRFHIKDVNKAINKKEPKGNNKGNAIKSYKLEVPINMAGAERSAQFCHHGHMCVRGSNPVGWG